MGQSSGLRRSYAPIPERMQAGLRKELGIDVDKFRHEPAGYKRIRIIRIRPSSHYDAAQSAGDEHALPGGFESLLFRLGEQRYRLHCLRDRCHVFLATEQIHPMGKRLALELIFFRIGIYCFSVRRVSALLNPNYLFLTPS